MSISHARRADPGAVALTVAPRPARAPRTPRAHPKGHGAVQHPRAATSGSRSVPAGEPGPDPGLTIPRPAHGPGHNSSWSHPRDRKCARTTLSPHVTRACAPRDPRSRDRIGVYLMDDTHHARHADPPYPSHIAERPHRAIGSATAPRPSRPKPSSQQRKSATLGHGDRSR